MIVLVLRNSFLILSSDDEDLLENIYNTLTFNDTSKAYNYYKGFDKDKIKKVRFAKFIDGLDLPSLRIPIGFEYFIKSVLEDYEHTVIDERPELSKIDINNIKLNGIDFWEHQIEEIRTALNNRRGIIKAPTGSGKTETFLAILKLLNSPSLVVFNRVQITHQTRQRAEDRGLEAGIIQGSNVLEKNITMATINSIKKIDKIEKYKNLILDECHGCSADNYQKLIKLKHWERIYGFSATPIHPTKFTLKTAKIVSNIGNIIFEEKPKALIDKGIIAKPKIIFLPVTQPEDIDGFDYRNAEALGIVNNPYRNNLIKLISEKHSDEKRLILTKYVKQGEIISNLLEAPFIWHETKLNDRLKILDQFDNGDLNLLVASRILDEGIDIKNFTVLIIASAGTSFTKTIQRLGRGLRITKKKKYITVYDFWDETHNILLKWSKNRKKDYASFGYKDILNIKEEEDIDLYLRLRSM